MYPPELRLRFPFHRELAATGTAQLLVADYYGAGKVSIGVMLMEVVKVKLYNTKRMVKYLADEIVPGVFFVQDSVERKVPCYIHFVQPSAHFRGYDSQYREVF